MKPAIIAAGLTTMAIAAFAFSQFAVRKSVAEEQPNNSATTNESPFACDTLALTSEERKHHFEELGPTLLKLRKSVRELPDGYEFEFPSDQKTFQLLTQWAIGERLCCPFFEINLRLEREGGPLWIRLTGREGTKDFIKADAPAWIKQ